MKMLNKESIKKIINPVVKPIIICILIPIILELTLFNMRAHQSRNYQQVTGMGMIASPNLEMRDWNIYEVVSLDEQPYIDIEMSQMQVDNVYVDVWPKAEPYNVDRIRMHFYVSDEGNPVGYSLPVIDYTRSVMQTMYTSLDLSGECRSFRIVFDEGISEGDLLRIENVSFNIPVPFGVSKKRIIALACILMMLYFLRPSSEIYKVKATDKFRGKKLVIALFMLVMTMFMWNVVNLNGEAKTIRYETEHQFEMMAEALVNGSPFLLKEPPAELVAMDNPYSYQGREAIGIQDSIMYDTGYYDGHYFVYFGVGPILLFYVPYYLITGSFIPTYVIMFMIGIMVMGGWLFLLYQMIKRYFRDFSFMLYLVVTALFTSGCGLTFVLSRPNFYPIPMTMGLVCVLYGLGFWIKSLPVDAETLTDNGEDAGTCRNGINPLYVCLGSLFMAFTAACRPQFLIGSFLAIPLFWNAVFKERKLLSKDSIKSTVCFALPYIVIAAGVMYYNYIRFTNPFDFGANYNLTFNDMTFRGFRLNRFLYGFLGFLFIPCKVVNKFPYLAPAAYTPRYMGYPFDEQVYGGLFYHHLYLLAVLLVPKARNIIKDRALYVIALATPIMSAAVAVIDANMAGVINRYFVDFSWLMMLSFFILLGYAITDKGMIVYKKIIANAFYILAIVSFIHMFLTIFGGDINGLENNNINVFYKVASMIEFWN